MRRNNLFKVLSVHLMSLSLLLAPMPLLSAEKGPEVDNSEWVGTVGGILDSVGKQVIQSKQQQAAMMQQASMMNSMRPQVVPAKFFPQCRISPAGASVPINACKPTPNLQQAVQSSQALQNVAQQNMDFYEQLLDEAQNSPMPSGIACLKQAMEGVKSSVQDRVNALERLKEQIAKSNQLFEEANKQILEDIKRNGNELYGARGGKFDMNQETAEYDKLVTPECRDIIGQDKFKVLIYDKGFLGVRDGKLSDMNQQASQLVANKASYEADLNQKVQQIKSDIKKYGVDGFAGMNSGGLSFERNGQESFGSLDKAFKEKMAEKNTEISNIRSKIKSEVGGGETADKLDRLMRLDENFKADFGEFEAQASQQLKRESISECVSGPVGLSTNQILSSLRYDSTGMSGDTIINYKNALQVILDNSDASPSEKEASIKSLDARFKGKIRIVYNDEDSVQRNESPFQMFQKIVTKCETVYEQETDGNIGRSTKKRVERAKKYMKDLQAIERTFASDLTNHLIDEVVNCSGRKLKAGSCEGGPNGSMSTSSADFCMAQATDCAAQANSCYKQINNQVKERQGRINNLSTTYNNNVAALITQQEGILNNVKAQVQRDSEFFKGFFPGSTYGYPEDLFVKMPQLADFNDMKGIELRGGGDIETLKTLPDKIGKLQDALLAQWSGSGGPGKNIGGKGIQGTIEEYIALQAGAMEKNRDKWSALKKQCTAAEQGAIAAINEANKKAAEQYGETKNKVNEYCQRFDDLRSNPMAGCNDDYDVKGLYEDGMKINAHISDDAQRYVGTYRGICAQSQNEKDSAEDKYEDNGEDLLKKACERGDSSYALKQMLDAIKDYGDLSSAEIDEISKTENNLSTPSITKILEKVKSNKALIEIITAYMGHNNNDFHTKRDELLATMQAAMDAAKAVAEATGATENAKAKAAAANRIGNNLKKDTGYCNIEKMKAFKDALDESTNGSEFDTAMKAFDENKGMKETGRAIASVAQSPVRNPLSMMGQAEYEDIDCEATASNGRFGGDMFDSFDRGILGGDPSSFLGGLGK